MSTTVFPIDGSANKAALFALLLGQDNTTDFVGDGLEVSVDTAQSVISVSGGHCYIQVDTGTISGTDKQVDDLGYAVQLPPTTVEPTTTGSVAVAVEPNYDAPNSVSVTTYPDMGSIPTDALGIAAVDMDSGAVTEYNRHPEITATDLTVVGHATVDGGLTVSDTVTVEADIVTGSDTTLVDESGTIQASQLSDTEITINTTGDLTGGKAVSLGGSLDLGVDVHAEQHNSNQHDSDDLHNDAVGVPSYQTTDDVGDIATGQIVHIESDESLYIEKSPQ